MNKFYCYIVYLKQVIAAYDKFEEVYINAMRSVAANMLHNAKQGHTGMAMSAAPIVYTLYTKFVNIAVNDPKWINRDRVVLSAGHGSSILYALFYLCNLLSLEDIQNFRKENSKTPGHPECEDDNFIDASTGPLGQGIANAVGMAIAEKYMNNRWKQLDLIDHYTYVIAGDGDIQEGISYEAMSLAGKLKLNKLIILHDSNDYQLDSAVNEVFDENLFLRCVSCNWNYLKVDNKPSSIEEAILKAHQSSKPTYIEIRTIIGEGTSKSANHKAHGLAVSDAELASINKHFNLTYKNWKYPAKIKNLFDEQVIERCSENYQNWLSKLKKLEGNLDYLTFTQRINGNFTDIFNEIIIGDIQKTNVPTKTYLKNVFDALVDFKDIITLSADLASTTNCKLGRTDFAKDINSGYIMAGIREFAMAAIQNGILLHKGLLSFSGTFLSFVDYQKSAIRVGALSKLSSNYILTHDSYMVGGDGPTHQPYDQLPMLRAIDNVYTYRPCDENEFINCFKLFFIADNKTKCLILTRQPTISGLDTKKGDVSLGGYEIFNPYKDDVDITFVASGSEVELAVESAIYVKENLNVNIKVVSVPSIKLLLNQPAKYISNLIKSDCGVLCIEASSDYIWYKLSEYTTKKIRTLRALTFGKSMDGKTLYEQKGFNKDNILVLCKGLING